MLLRGFIGVVILFTGISAISACDGVWECVRSDIADNITSIFKSDSWNLTPDGRIVAERIRDSNRPVKKVPSDAGVSRLIGDSIRVFDTHQILWRFIPGILDVRIFKHEGEGMDFGIDMPGSADGRTWRVGMRRRITMALLPIMYKLGVGTTLLGVLVFIGMKTAAMVSVLFVLAIGSLAKHKFGFLSQSNHNTGHWTPPPPTQVAPIHKEVHVHVHADTHKQPDHHWYRKPPHDEYEAIGPGGSPDPFSGPMFSYGDSGYGGYSDEPTKYRGEPEILYRAPFRRWPTSRVSTSRPSPVWSPSPAHITGALPAAYAMNPRWALQRFMDQEPPVDLDKNV